MIFCIVLLSCHRTFIQQVLERWPVVCLVGRVRGVSRGCLVGERRMRPLGVVILDPLGDRLSGLVEGKGQGLVQ